jgi:hypothetical protein
MIDKDFDAVSAKFLKDNGLQFATLAEIDAKLHTWKGGSAEDKALAERLEVISDSYLPISGAKFVEDPSMRDLVKIRAEMMVIMRGEANDRLESYVRRVLKKTGDEAKKAIAAASIEVAKKFRDGKIPCDLEPMDIKDAIVGVLAMPALMRGMAGQISEIVENGKVSGRGSQVLE